MRQVRSQQNWLKFGHHITLMPYTLTLQLLSRQDGSPSRKMLPILQEQAVPQVQVLQRCPWPQDPNLRPRQVSLLDWSEGLSQMMTAILWALHDCKPKTLIFFPEIVSSNASENVTTLHNWPLFPMQEEGRRRRVPALRAPCVRWAGAALRRGTRGRQDLLQQGV